MRLLARRLTVATDAAYAAHMVPQALDRDTLIRDLEAAKRALDAPLQVTEEQHALQSARVVTLRRIQVRLPVGATTIRARFVKQGWAELAKKIFVKEVEVGERTFDDTVYVATETPDAVRALLGALRVRQAVLALVERDCVIDVEPDVLTVSHDDAVNNRDEETAETLALFAHLAGRA